MRRSTGERKPAWLRSFIPEPNLSHLVTRKCAGCGLYIIEDRENIWQQWDYGIIHGENLTVAVILGRALARVTWITAARQPRLTGVCGTAGLKPDGRYLAAHECGHARISVEPYKPPRRERPPGKPWGGPDLDPDELAEFTRVWNLPCEALRT
ncbi:hypothetical protein [Bifidobacterium sp. SO4]|uniref:hypothetical protein n=1 Tax=Bifidobacterium sp. SO4 TaxID=2809030 RepID=UPI001F0B1AD6|nr:hypothetical protein [Bifidobacterium sp. SO4]